MRPFSLRSKGKYTQLSEPDAKQEKNHNNSILQLVSTLHCNLIYKLKFTHLRLDTTKQFGNILYAEASFYRSKVPSYVHNILTIALQNSNLKFVF
jgi:hypothetical protein